MKRIILLVVLLSGTIVAQDNRIAQFTIWRPKETQPAAFQRGYQQHIKWRKTAGDPWEWYGWYIASGSRIGWFVEATFNHAWSDFDSPVDPVEQGVSLHQNVLPYADVRSAFKAFFLKDQSIVNSASLRSKMIRMITIEVKDMPAAVRVVDRFKNSFRSNSDVTTMMVYKVIDGGNANQLILLIGSNSWEQYGKTENIQDQLTNIENSMKIKPIEGITSETLMFAQEMSLVPE
jgi:hypothetical protein